MDMDVQTSQSVKYFRITKESNRVCIIVLSPILCEQTELLTEILHLFNIASTLKAFLPHNRRYKSL